MMKAAWRLPAALTGGLVITALALWLRVAAQEHGLVYPDGYQYLLMARGIGAHLSPTLQLGIGGVLFVPSVDAALKPFFPALVALLSPFTGTRGAANVITLAASAATPLFAGVLAGRLAGSRSAAVLAAGAALISPALGYWSGFAGPDPLAEALVLATALAITDQRAALAGVCGGLCAATRPEWGLLLASAGMAALAAPCNRALAGRALTIGAFVLAGVVGVLRPPLALPVGGPGLLLGAVAAGTALQLGARWASGTPRRATGIALAALALILVMLLHGPGSGPGALLHSEWPLLALAAFGVLRACRAGHGRPGLVILAAIGLLGGIYSYRNPGSERYLAQLLPLACVCAGFAVVPGASVSHRERIRHLMVPAAGIVLLLLVTSPRPRLADDTFAALARPVATAPAGTLISAAPDAYGFLLPTRSHQSLRIGAHGLVLLDGAQRAYWPGLTARGAVIARLRAAQGFERPDGTLDTAPALLVRGVVVPVPGAGRRTTLNASGSGALPSAAISPSPG